MFIVSLAAKSMDVEEIRRLIFSLDIRFFEISPQNTSLLMIFSSQKHPKIPTATVDSDNDYLGFGVKGKMVPFPQLFFF